jgi:cytochrome c oxidase assembly protein subunit 15
MHDDATEEVRRDRVVLAWLWLLFGMVFAMEFIGGATRLTGSGLSMVEWRPLMGVIPPIGTAEWSEVFARYQESPQYQEVNSWMRLDDFKRIFFWEYVHRAFGRLIGIVALVPWLLFVLQKRLPAWLARRSLVAIALGGLQGLLGWYMVRSGLVDRPEVSHFRLAAHLLLAILIAQWVLWILLDIHYPRAGRKRGMSWLPALCFSLIGLIALQIVYGAFMAGTQAGLLFPSFPDMNGVYAPQHFFTSASLLADLLENPHAIHWVHRMLGWLLVLCVGLIAYRVRSEHQHIVPAWAPSALVLLALAQFVLGALTAVYQVPLLLGVGHQAGAFLMISSATLVAHGCLRRDVGSGSEPAGR